MSEIKQKKNIEWSERSINVITGCNGPDGKRCEYCYAQRIALRFEGRNGYPIGDPFKPTYHSERLQQILSRKKPTIWFFGSQCDWLDDGVLPTWRANCLNVMARSNQHIFITLTKQYKNLWKAPYDSPNGKLPKNVILGISVTNREQVWGIEELRNTGAYCKMISFEPLLENISNIINLDGIDWVIIGGKSKQPSIKHLPASQKFGPPENWVWGIVEKAKSAAFQHPIPITRVFMKPNIGFSKRLEEYPFELKDDKLRFVKERYDESKSN